VLVSPAHDETIRTGPSPVRIHIKKVSPKDAQSLRDEMAILGQVLATEQTADSLTVWLDSTVSIEDIEAVCCFIVDAEQLSITPQAPPIQQEVEAFARAAAEFSAQTFSSTGALAKDRVSSISSVQTSSLDQAGRRPADLSSSADKESASIRVSVEKVDQVMNLVGELVITQAMLVQATSSLDPMLYDRLLNGMEQLQRNARDLQDAVMSIRMMPIDYVFSRFPRLVRDLAGKMGKQIELQTYGRSTELDKSLIERIIDPLTHLVRNSLDHGIETPEERLAAGKDSVGRLVMSAQHNGGNIVIEVSDDGAGLNRQKILEKALAQGLSVSEDMPDEDVWQLIFAPGFSTADQVTDISGRGVGMDVVRRNIHDLGGQVQLSCVPGQGTTTRIILPLTLAILDGMSVHVGKETFILPLSYVTESLQPTHEQLYSLAGNERVMQVRGEYLPLVELHKLFSVANAQTDPTHAIAVIIQAEERRFALLVDQLIGQHQVVVKNLESNYRKVPGISAATILGDGSVALIIDVFAVARAHSKSWLQPEVLAN